jgi:hypothetical protein
MIRYLKHLKQDVVSLLRTGPSLHLLDVKGISIHLPLKSSAPGSELAHCRAAIDYVS